MEGRDILAHLRPPGAARSSADTRLLLQCIGVSLSRALHHDGEGARGSDFRPYRALLCEYASRQTVMWQPTLGMIIYAQVLIFHSTAKA